MKVVLLLILAVFLIYPLHAAPIGWNLPPVGNITFSSAVKKILDSRANVTTGTVSPVQDSVWDTVMVRNTTLSLPSAPATLSYSDKMLLTTSLASAPDQPTSLDTDTTTSGVEQDSTTPWSYFYVTVPTTVSPLSAVLGLKSGEQDEPCYDDVLHLAFTLLNSPLAVFLAVFMALGMSFFMNWLSLFRDCFALPCRDIFPYQVGCRTGFLNRLCVLFQAGSAWLPCVVPRLLVATLRARKGYQLEQMLPVLCRMAPLIRRKAEFRETCSVLLSQEL